MVGIGPVVQFASLQLLALLALALALVLLVAARGQLAKLLADLAELL